MGSKTDYAEGLTLDLLFRTVPAGWTRPHANLYIALTTTVPTDAAAGAEVAYTGYARAVVAASNAAIARAGDTASNVADILWPVVAGGPTALVVGWEIYDAAVAGNRLTWGEFPVGMQKVYVDYDQPIVPAGQLTLQED